MYVGERANEQMDTLLTSVEAELRRVVDLAIEADCATIMYEAQRIACDVQVLRKCLINREDLESITDTFDLFGDPADPSVEELEAEERFLEEECCPLCGGVCDDDSDEDGEDEEEFDPKDYDTLEVTLERVSNTINDFKDAIKKSKDEYNEKPKKKVKKPSKKEED